MRWKVSEKETFVNDVDFGNRKTANGKREKLAQFLSSRSFLFWLNQDESAINFGRRKMVISFKAR